MKIILPELCINLTCLSDRSLYKEKMYYRNNF